LQNVKGVAYKGEVKNVKDGYFQNFLLPKKVAILATPEKIKEVEELRKKMVVEKERLMAEARDISRKLEGKTYKMKRKSHDEKLYATITEKDLIDDVLKHDNIKLAKENVIFPSSIKKLGKFEVTLKLAENVSCKVHLEVESEK